VSSRTLDDHVREYYSRQELRPEALARLLSLTDLSGGRTGRPADAPSRTRGSRMVAGAAALAVALLLAAVGLTYLTRSGQPRAGKNLDRSARVAYEIARNHMKNEAIEFRGSDYVALSRQMAELEFELRPPARLAGSAYDVFGARYCSIQGQRAAQIKLKDPEERVLTLYETPWNESLVRAAGREYRFDRVRVSLWRENRIFLGLAQTDPTGPPE
jgi:hypothetical protein